MIDIEQSSECWATPQNDAWFTDHYNNFYLLAEARYLTRAKTTRDFFSK